MQTDLNFGNGQYSPERSRAINDIALIRRKDALGRLDKNHAALLDSIDPEWRLTLLQKRWQRLLNGAIGWCDDHQGDLPRKGSNDPLEAKLSSWLGTQRQGATPERRAILDDRLPGWNLRSPDDVWVAHLGEVKEWFWSHPGTYPSERSADESEVRVRQWVNNQKQKATPERRAQIDLELPGWSGVDRDAQWSASLASLVAWSAANPRQPLPPRTQKPDGQWLGIQRGPKLKPERRARLDATLPGWDAVESLDDRWTASLESLIKWVSLNGGARPGRTVKPEGSWLFVQRYDKSVTDQRRATLDVRLPGWRDTSRS